MKVAIVVPYSWSYWGGVVEHAEEQSAALEGLGIATRVLIGSDPPGAFSRFLHPRTGRSDEPPDRVIPLGRSVIVPANASLANIVLSPAAIPTLKRVLRSERFDLMHVHEPLTPVVGPAALSFADVPIVATFHAAGTSRWRALAMASWGFLLDRIDARIAVSEAARRATEAYAPGEYLVIPNGVRLPPRSTSARSGGSVLFVGRHEARKGLPVLLAAWPRVHARTGARLRIVGADPLAVRLLISRSQVDERGIDLLGPVSRERLDSELSGAKLLVAPSLRGESFGMVLTRAFASGTPVVASDIEGYREVIDPGNGRLVPPGDVPSLAAAIEDLLSDEAARLGLAAGARAAAEQRYAWPPIAAELRDLYSSLLGTADRRLEKSSRRGGHVATAKTAR